MNRCWCLQLVGRRYKGTPGPALEVLILHQHSDKSQQPTNSLSSKQRAFSIPPAQFQYTLSLDLATSRIMAGARSFSLLDHGVMAKPYGYWVIDDVEENHVVIGGHWKKLMTDREKRVNEEAGVFNIVQLPAIINGVPTILDLKNVEVAARGEIRHGYNIISSRALQRDGLEMGRFAALDGQPEYRVWWRDHLNAKLKAEWSHDMFFAVILDFNQQKQYGVWQQEEARLPQAIADEERRLRDLNLLDVANAEAAALAAQQQQQPWT